MLTDIMYPNLGKLFLSFIFLFSSFICWYFWKIAQKYKYFPTPISDVRWVFNFLTGKYPKSILFDSRAFSLTMEICKKFEKDGLCFAWGLQPMLLIFGEEYAKVLLNHPYAVNKPLNYKIFPEAVGKGLLHHQRPTWRKVRRIMNPAFKFSILKKQVYNFNCIGRSLANQLMKASDIPPLYILKLHSLRNVFETLFELQVDSKEEEQRFIEVAETVNRLEIDTAYRVDRPWLFWMPMALLFSKERRENHESIDNFIKNTAEKVIKSMSSSEENKSEDESNTQKSFTRILTEHYINDPSFTLPMLVEEIKTFIVAGQGTVALTLNWCLFMLAVHPEIQERAYEEVKSVTDLSDADISYDDLSKLSYIECIIKETLRLYPPVVVFGRYTTEEIECGKYKIPKNTALYFNIYFLQRNANIYPDPEKFNPERFYEKSLKHPWAFVPFSEGYRSCIGKNFAMTQMKISLAHILRKMKITSPDTMESVDGTWQILLAPKRPVRFTFTPRLHEE